MAISIDAALRAIEQRIRSAIRIDETESVAIEAARSGLAVLRGEWFGGLAESMTGSLPSKRVVILDLFRTSRDGTEWLGSFRDIEEAIAKLKEWVSANPGYYYVCDQATGETVLAEDAPEE